MGNKKIAVFAALLLFVFIVANVSALTAKIGSARMTLRAETGEEVARSILVINDNPDTVNITLTASGDLADNVELEETEFQLAPGEQRKAYFNIHADEAGTTETRINVGFVAASGEGNNAGFASVITFIATGESLDVDNEGPDVVDGEDSGSVVVEEGDGPSNGLSTLMILFIAGIVLIVVLIILLVFASKRSKGNKKGSGRPRA